MFLSEEEQIVYDWQFGAGGDFFMYLCEAIARADAQNMAKLAISFPVHVRAINRFHNEDGFWENILKKVGIDKVDCK